MKAMTVPQHVDSADCKCDPVLNGDGSIFAHVDARVPQTGTFGMLAICGDFLDEPTPEREQHG